MKKQSVFFLILFIVLLLAAFKGYAQMVDYKRLQKIRQERGSQPMTRRTFRDDAKDMPGWLKKEPEVTNRTERRYDVNGDRRLQSAEVKVYLRSVLDVVDKKGSFTINSDILKEYDQNKDGVISRFEAKVIEAQVG